MKKKKNIWHTLEAEAVLSAFRSNAEEGLSHKEAIKRRRALGKNSIWQVNTSTLMDVIRNEFLDLAVILLMVAILFSALFNKTVESAVLLCLLLVSAVLRVAVLLHARRTFETAARANIPTASVLREGTVTTLPADAVVPGDILHFSPGDPVVADVRLLIGELNVTEIGITENRHLQSKAPDTLPNELSVCEERTNILYAGSTVVTGKGVGITVASGEDTYIFAKRGHIAIPAGEGIPLISRLSHWCRRVSLFMIVAVLVITFVGLFTREPSVSLDALFLSALSLAVSSSSEFLVVVASEILARTLTKVEARCEGTHLRRPSSLEAFGNIRCIILTQEIAFSREYPFIEKYTAICKQEGISLILLAKSVTDIWDKALKAGLLHNDTTTLTTMGQTESYLTRLAHKHEDPPATLCIQAGDRESQEKIVKILCKTFSNTLYIGDSLRDIPLFSLASASVAASPYKKSCPQCLFSAADASVCEGKGNTRSAFCDTVRMIRLSKQAASRIRKVAEYFLFIEALRLVLVLACAVYGLPVFSSATLLWWGLVLDFFAILAFAFPTRNAPPKKEEPAKNPLPTWKDGLLFPLSSGVLSGLLLCLSTVLVAKATTAGPITPILYIGGLLAGLTFLFLSGNDCRSSCLFFSIPTILTIAFTSYSHVSSLLFCALIPVAMVVLLFFIYRTATKSEAKQDE